MPRLIAFAATLAIPALAITGCETMRTIAPNTTSGFEEGGVLGALQGASGALLVTCRTLDGQEMQVAIDDLATITDATDEIEDARERRQKACAAAGAVHVISAGLDGALPAVSVHLPAPGSTAAPAAIPPAGAGTK